MAKRHVRRGIRTLWVRQHPVRSCVTVTRSQLLSRAADDENCESLFSTGPASFLLKAKMVKKIIRGASDLILSRCLLNWVVSLIHRNLPLSWIRSGSWLNVKWDLLLRCLYWFPFLDYILPQAIWKVNSFSSISMSFLLFLPNAHILDTYFTNNIQTFGQAFVFLNKALDKCSHFWYNTIVVDSTWPISSGGRAPDF